jgi:hypothetical protein
MSRIFLDFRAFDLLPNRDPATSQPEKPSIRQKGRCKKPDARRLLGTHTTYARDPLPSSAKKREPVVVA